MFAFPIAVSTVALGTLQLHRVRPGPLGSAEIAEQALSAVAQVVETLLDPRLALVLGDEPTTPVHQAAGMAMVQTGLSIEESLALLRATSYVEGTRLLDLSKDVVRRRRRLGGEIRA